MVKPRRHAGYWRVDSGEFKKSDELFAVEKLLESMEKIGDQRYHSPRSTREDPPDCVAENEHGCTVGFEVTELVDESAVAQAEKGISEDRFWELGQVVTELERILAEKDRVDYGDAGYPRIILVICTDEYTLSYNDFRGPLSDYHFPELNRIDEAYFLFSFDPYEDRCPYILLRCGNRPGAENPRSDLSRDS